MRVSSGAAPARVGALDGLRGVAVTAVVVNHLRPDALRGGWLGVDVFFVLSGYLITTLLLSEHSRTGQVGLRGFYARRARRLLPALFLLLAVLAIVARMDPQAAGFQDLRGDGLSALGYVANWHFIATGASYFGAFSPSPLRHLWSLSVEEQFYLVWPLLLVVVLRRYGRRAVGYLALGLAVASAVAMALTFSAGDISRVYFGTDTHAHGVLLGCALGVLGPSFRTWPYRRVASLLALFGLGVAFFALSGTSTFAYRGGIFAVGALTAVVIAGLVAPGARGPAAWALSLGPLRALGRISYGVYLWHWPVLVFVTPERAGVSGWTLVALQLALTLGLAVASYFLVERPVLAGWPRVTWSWAGFVGAATAVALALTLVVPDVAAPFAVAEQRAVSRDAGSARLPPPRVVPTGGSAPAAGPRRVVVVGDSVAYTLFPGLVDHERGSRLYFLTAARTGCPLDVAATEYRGGGLAPMAAGLPSYCEWPRVWPPMIDRVHPALVVALWGLWDLYDHEIGHRWYVVGTPAWRTHMEQTLEHALDIVTKRGAHVIVLTTPYLFDFSHARVDALNAVFRAVAARRPRELTVVDIQGAIDRIQPQRWDDVHFTVTGADALGGAVVAKIAVACGAPCR